MNALDKTICLGIKTLEYSVLAIIVIATAFVIAHEVYGMIAEGNVGLANILLLFIYVEVLTMVGVFITSGEFPVRIPLYIGVVALVRHITIDMSHMDNITLLTFAGTIIMLAVAAIVIKAGRTLLKEPK